ncbi:universal stress protein [Natranaeroarchaeum sulfidigenes]|uniref:Nucleotide-binding protein, UspA family n=1 Tax=Natranaeroarchaeum sulfidigenes TaxID=2784880 RepID=A0A897MWZ2_9EURY|nr:universal stress protein [Natranaeroarchaeum sulfidigenes]QSG03613.1 Nucleotide-binding protein, UspA family [Natranaeroarchaeum sulfidigenes]
MYDEILLATDGSDDAAAAADHALDHAERYDATLHLVSVVETRTAYDNAIVDPETVAGNLRKEARKTLDLLAERAEAAGVETTTEILEGVPHEAIENYAAERDVDLILLGTQGRSAFKRALLGSTTDSIVRSRVAPVLVVGEDRD